MMNNDIEFMREACATSLADAGLVDEWLTVMAPVVIGSKRISKSIRGTAFSNKCDLVDGDTFYAVGLSDYAECEKFSRSDG